MNYRTNNYILLSCKSPISIDLLEETLKRPNRLNITPERVPQGMLSGIRLRQILLEVFGQRECRIGLK